MISLEAKPLLRSACLMRRALLLILGILIATALGTLGWIAVDLDRAGLSLAELTGYGSAALRVWQSVALGAILLGHIVIWIAVVWRGQQIFAALLREDVEAASMAAAQAARLLWIMLIWGVLANTLAALVATWHFPDGQRALVISFGSAQISTVLAAVLATFTSRAFVFGAALWQDHKAVI
ncbi:hypothetical protein [Litoreibacter roseus]|uniref:DUF2975 family protein n=1 Tax=Litoreibacter roseus TaxID=2601869 RepID=A0A6N6JCD1_9RHOB|nr:hypothetical protein [Litoreibacter roseus]GFE63744.1 hypothetical protein KIN_08180 [Litoreibacter roseus]